MIQKLPYIGLLVVLNLVLALPVAFAQEESNGLAKDEQRELRKLTRQAEGHLRFNEYYEALGLLQKAHQLAPGNATVNREIGRILLFQQQPFKAIPYLEKAHQSEPITSADVLLEFASAAFTAERLTLAKSLFLTAKENSETAVQRERAATGLLQLARAERLLKQQQPVIVIPLMPPINTEYDEFAPTVTANRRQLFFTTQRPENVGGTDVEGVYYEDIYAASYDAYIKQFTKPYQLEGSLNSTKHDACMSVSPDGRKLLVFQQRNKGDIYTSRLRDSLWRSPVALQGEVNSRHRETSATLSPNGQMLIFSSDRPGGQGGMDLWLAFKNKRNEWDSIVNLGDQINTPFDEDAPFWHASNKTLYFSSQGHESMGGFDLFVAKRLNATSWGDVRSLGSPINSTADDHFFQLEPTARFGYFASKRLGGMGGYDLYQVDFRPPEAIASTERKTEKLERKAPSTEVQLADIQSITESIAQLKVLSGTVKGELEKQPLGASIFITDNATGSLIDSTQSDPTTGEYLLSLPAGKDYGVSVRKADFLAYSTNIVLPDSLGYEELKQDITLMPMQLGAESDLQNIFFEVGSARLKPSSQTEVDYLKSLLERYPQLTLEIIGHTDNTGGLELNMRLSQQRAQAVVDALIASDVKPKRLSAKGMGSKKPVASNDTESGRAQNRRVSFKVTATE